MVAMSIDPTRVRLERSNPPGSVDRGGELQPHEGTFETMSEETPLEREIELPPQPRPRRPTDKKRPLSFRPIVNKMAI